MATRMSYERANRIAQAWYKGTSLKDAMRRAGVTAKDQRTLNRYRRMAEELTGVELIAHNAIYSPNIPRNTERIELKKGNIVIFSDAHFWPLQRSDAFKILLQVIDDLKPKIVIDNGDSWDLPMISRHAKNTWEHYPTPAEELECVRERLAEIEEVTPNKALLRRNIGNHDLRFEAKIANMIPELEDMPCTTISELFPHWEHNYSLMLNDEVMIKHKTSFGGKFPERGASLNAGKSMIISHHHHLRITRITDFNGTRFGACTGTLADIYAPQFSYMEDNPRDWQSGFLVLHVDGGIHPVEVHVKDGKAIFNGKTYKA